MPPAYFYHLAFELYPYPATTGTNEATLQQEIHLPGADTNIFETPLPSHQYATLTPKAQSKTTHRRTRSTHIQRSPTKQKVVVGPGLPNRTRTQANLGANFATGTNGTTTAAEHKLAATDNKASQVAHIDWRFDRVAVESIDMVPAKHLNETRKDTSGSYIEDGISAGPSGLATKGRYVPLDPKNTELGWGIVHLYRDAQETPGLYDDELSSSDSEAGRATTPGEENEGVLDEDCTTLCILAVPSYLTPADFLGFVGEQTRQDVSHFRMIRTGRVNRYMVLMKFRDAKKAKAWRKEWNGKAFNSMEPENCHVVFVKSIEFQVPAGLGHATSFPDMTNDPFTPNKSAQIPQSAPIPAASSSLAPAPLTTKPLAPPTPALVELPTCPVCLERMDETTGLLTILCQHVFHCACLQKWRGSGCPVCRYTQGDGMGRISGRADGEEPENECSVCGSVSNLWICLICGNVGCGRYDSAHAFSHYQQTSHCYAMDVATQRVWDYAGDGYVHRLIQNASDGKLVELPSALGNTNSNLSYTGLSEDVVPREKLDNIGMEYTYLLTSQLDSQRLYFEEKVERAVDKAAQASSAAEKASEMANKASQALAEMKLEYDHVTKEILPGLEKEKTRAERRAEKLEALSRRMEKQWQEEKVMAENLFKRVEGLGKEKEALSKEVERLKERERDLEDQNRDLSFFISGTEKLKAQGEEVREGTLEIPEPKPDPKKRKGKGRR